MNDIYKTVAIKLGLKEKDVKEAYLSMWRFIKDKIKDFDISSEEVFLQQKSSFNIPRLGKFYGKWKRYDLEKQYVQNKSSKTVDG